MVNVMQDWRDITMDEVRNSSGGVSVWANLDVRAIERGDEMAPTCDDPCDDDGCRIFLRRKLGKLDSSKFHLLHQLHETTDFIWQIS